MSIADTCSPVAPFIASNLFWTDCGAVSMSALTFGVPVLGVLVEVLFAEVDVDVVLGPVEAVEELPVEEALVEEVVLVSAEAGAATARTVPPAAASPKATRAAAPARRVLIM
jgi:hypothetical protein